MNSLKTNLIYRKSEWDTCKWWLLTLTPTPDSWLRLLTTTPDFNSWPRLLTPTPDPDSWPRLLTPTPDSNSWLRPTSDSDRLPTPTDFRLRPASDSDRLLTPTILCQNFGEGDYCHCSWGKVKTTPSLDFDFDWSLTTSTKCNRLQRCASLKYSDIFRKHGHALSLVTVLVIFWCLLTCEIFWIFCTSFDISCHLWSIDIFLHTSSSLAISCHLLTSLVISWHLDISLEISWHPLVFPLVSGESFSIIHRYILILERFATKNNTNNNDEFSKSE